MAIRRAFYMDRLHLTATFRNYLTALRAFWLLVSSLLIVSELAATVLKILVIVIT
jgi:hypothetical protein